MPATVPTATTATPSREILEGAGDLLRALAAPVRIAIVLQLHASRRCVREVKYHLVDHHLAHIVLDAVAHAGEDR